MYGEILFNFVTVECIDWINEWNALQWRRVVM